MQLAEKRKLFLDDGSRFQPSEKRKLQNEYLEAAGKTDHGDESEV